MVVFLLLVIIAIMLFGANAILGVIGRLLGIVVLFVAAAYAMSGWNSLGALAKWVILLTPPVLVIVSLAILWLIDRQQQPDMWMQAQERRRLEDMERQRVELAATPIVKFHSRAPTKAERKQMRER